MIDKDLLKQTTLLYVEDDEIIRNEINNIFKNLFKNVFCTENGKEALEIYNESSNKIDIIVSDIVMPEMNGLELLSEIKKLDNTMPFIFTTAYSDANYLLEGLKNGASDYFIKPLNLEELLLKIQKVAKKIFADRDIHILQNEINDYLETINKVAIVFSFDEDGNVNYINDFYKELSKYNEEEVLGKKFYDLYHSDIAKDVIAHQIELLVTNGESWKGKLKFHSKDNIPFYTCCDIVPLSTESVKKFIAINFITSKEEASRREFKKKVLYNFNETKKIFKKAQEKIDELNFELQKFKGYDKKEEELNKLKFENSEFLLKIKDAENKLKVIRRKHEIFTNDVNVKIKEISLSTEEMKDFTVKSGKKIDYIKKEIVVREHFIQKITEEIELKKRKVQDLEDVLVHRDSQVDEEKSEYKELIKDRINVKQ